jgi:hypothetical protein
MNIRALVSAAAVALLVVGVAATIPVTLAQTPAPAVDTTPSRKTLDDASKDDCAAVSSVVQRCAQAPKDPNAKPDELSRSREQTKQNFDREDQRGTAEALKGGQPSVNTPVGDAQRLGGVTVNGKADNKLSVEEVLQRAIGPPTGVSNGNGTVSHYGANGVRYDCIEKCIGPACCAEVRVLPNPTRQIGGPGAF